MVAPPPSLAAGEIGEEYEERRAAEQPIDDLMGLVEQIVPYDMTHNAGKRPGLWAEPLQGWEVERCSLHPPDAIGFVCLTVPCHSGFAEPDAVDLLLEVERIDMLEAHAGGGCCSLHVAPLLPGTRCIKILEARAGGGCWPFCPGRQGLLLQ